MSDYMSDYMSGMTRNYEKEYWSLGYVFDNFKYISG